MKVTIVIEDGLGDVANVHMEFDPPAQPDEDGPAARCAAVAIEAMQKHFVQKSCEVEPS